MKILIIHNKYSKIGGEESVVDLQIELLKGNGHDVQTYYRNSSELEQMTFSGFKVFFTGIYNPVSMKDIERIIIEFKPEIVHIHNLYPLISPSILKFIRTKNIPIVMSVHNYRLMCPNGLFFTKGKICEECTSGIKEINCIINNCENSLAKSTGYALRNFWARFFKSYKNNVSAFLCLTNFQKDKLISNGYSEKKCQVLPNFYGKSIQNINYDFESRNYIAFAGRISPEKGIKLLLEAARKLPQFSFKVAGDGDSHYILELEIPENVQFVGRLNENELSSFYSRARFLIITSLWYEGFPMVIPESMAHKLPIIAPNMSCFPEIIVEGINGLLYVPGSLDSLASKIKNLYDNTGLLEEMALNNFKKSQENFGRDFYYHKLKEIYNNLI